MHRSVSTRVIAFAVTAVALVGAAVPAAAEAGALDPTFGGDGRVTTRVSGNGGFDVAYAVAVQPDGTIVAAGQADNSFAAVRYDTSGTLDTTFGRQGIVITPIAGNDTAFAMAVQPDGKIVVAGQTGNAAFAVVRYAANGTLDTAFGDGGKVTTELSGGPDVAYAVALQPDGKIVVAGQAGTGGGSDIAVVRYTEDGSLDPAFGTGGKVITTGPGVGAGYAVVVQKNGGILVGGESGGTFAVARYGPTGGADPSFGTAGIASTGHGAAYAMALQGEKILLAGSSGGVFALTRLDPTGAADPTFGRDGMATTPLSPGNDAAWGIVLQGDKIVIGGVASDSFGLARYNPNGVLDPTFDDDGTLTTNFTDITDSAYAIALQDDGSIIAAGSAGQGGGLADFALARYQP